MDVRIAYEDGSVETISTAEGLEDLIKPRHLQQHLIAGEAL